MPAVPRLQSTDVAEHRLVLTAQCSMFSCLFCFLEYFDSVGLLDGLVGCHEGPATWCARMELVHARTTHKSSFSTQVEKDNKSHLENGGGNKGVAGPVTQFDH